MPFPFLDLKMLRILIFKLVLFLPWVILLAVNDWRKHELPNLWTLGGALVAAVLAFAVRVDYGIFSILTGFFCMLLLLLPFFLRAAGAGDVKMIFAAGIIAGPGNFLNLTLLISLAGLLLAVVMMITKTVDSSRVKHLFRSLFDFRYDRKEGKKNLPPKTSEACRVPFGIAIGAGLLLNLASQLFYTVRG